MKILTRLIFDFLRLIFESKHDIVLENLALRQQLVVQQREAKKAEDQEPRPHLLDLAVKILEQLESITDCCHPPFCYCLAQERIQVLLETEIT